MRTSSVSEAEAIRADAFGHAEAVTEQEALRRRLPVGFESHFPIEARWLSEVTDPDVTVYVIEHDDGRVVGFAAVRGNELLHFGTAVETWGSGLAAAAHDLLIDEIRAADVPCARLRVFVDNDRARRFYDKLGWRCTDLISRSPFPPFPALVEYRLDL